MSAPILLGYSAPKDPDILKEGETTYFRWPWHLRLGNHVIRARSCVISHESSGTISKLNDIRVVNYDERCDGTMPSGAYDVATGVSRDNATGVIVNNKHTYRFSRMIKADMLIASRDNHRSDKWEEVIPTREHMIRWLDQEGFKAPWLIFDHSRIYPLFYQIPDEMVTRRKTPGVRYMELKITKSQASTGLIHKLADQINDLFYNHGIVAVRRVDPNERTYQEPREGSTCYHDLKLQVDRSSIFAPGISNGWYEWLEKEKKKW